MIGYPDKFNRFEKIAHTDSLLGEFERARYCVSDVLCTAELVEYECHTDPKLYLAKRWLVKGLVKNLAEELGLGVLNLRQVQLSRTSFGAPYVCWALEAEPCPNPFGSSWPLISLSDDSDQIAAVLFHNQDNQLVPGCNAVGVGVDILAQDRIKRAHLRLPSHFAKKILSESEYIQFAEQGYSTEYLARCWAMKEAVAKALGTGFREGIAMADIMLLNGVAGDACIGYQGKSAHIVQDRGIQHSLVRFKTFGHFTWASVLLLKGL